MAKDPSDRLHNQALHYLARFPASEARLRAVLERKAPGESALIEAEIERLKRAGLVDDAAYAAGLAGSLARRGRSARFISGKLRQKGLAEDHIEAALGGLETDEESAAMEHARRKRLGPWRKTPLPKDEAARRKCLDRELASLARAGFSVQLARRVLKGEGGGS
jgi:regulatory protein